MQVAPGTRLGPYEVIGLIGAGGMGEVFKARDTRLDRTVAIKILPSHVAADESLRERFDREARTIASLNHPHICTLHDVGHQSGVDFLVLEFVEGETLAARLARGRMPLDTVVQTAIEIADALDRAHRTGITHRDLKPGNVMLTRSGVKLLDFGLAKIRLAQAPPGTSSLDTRSLTQVGTLVGTLQYMAPEQLDGRPVDARTDIFALGAVIYEMATGRRAFDGDTQARIIGQILHTQPPPPSRLQPLASAALDHIVARCLAKDPEDRWQTARDVMLELRACSERPAPAAVEPPVPAARESRVPLAVLALVALAACAVAGWLALRQPAPAPVTRALLLAPEGRRFGFSGDFGGPPTLSPDGQAVAFVASDSAGLRQLWIRPLDALDARALPGTEGATFPFWSADGQALGFFAQGKLKRVDLAREGVLTICDAPSGRGGTWNRDGTILFAPTVADAIHAVAATGGSPRAVTRLASGAHASHRWPEFLPDGRHFVFLGIYQDPLQREQTGILLGSLEGGDPRPLIKSIAQAQVVGDDLVYLVDHSLVAQALDVDAGRLAGDSQTIARNVQHDPTIWRGIYSVAPTGTLVYQAGEEGGRTRLTWYDRTGRELGTIGESAIFFDLKISPDGRRVAVNRGDPADVWVYDLERGTGTRVTTDPANESLPIWAPDGERLVFSRHPPEGGGMLVEARADGSDSPRAVYEGDVMEASDWSPDGRFLLIKPGDIRSTPGDIWVLPLEGPRQPFAFIASAFAEFHAMFSPDGRWVSYVSNESGRDEVYVTAFRPPPAGSQEDGRDPARPGRWQISSAGGVLPRWRADGRELYFLAPDRRIMAAAVDGRGGAFQVSGVSALFQADPKPVGWLYDVAPDGTRFLVDTIGEDQDAPMVLVLNGVRR